jgi:glycosyltransferase involved in cell wall biosynthesis
VVIIDNDSDDETRELLGRLENAQVRFNDDNLGFGPANMAGAELARGEYLCFLNNDAIATPGWLSSLTRVLDEQADCAAVGGMLVGLDGTLQEAGSIVWRDGSSRGYGRGDDPDGDEYSYVRDVDFCSAACLLVRREVFDAVGGFDDRYAPAYYEDVDLCLAIWEAGHRVAYQPASRVLHVEYGSSGSEAAAQRQHANREKFVAKWGPRLEGRLEPGSRNVLRARDRRPGKRVLIVDDKIPDPELGSGFPRTRALIDALLAEGYVLTYLATADGRASSPTRRELQERGVEVLAGRRSIADFLRARANLYEAAIVSRPHNAHVIKSLKELNPEIRLLYDAEAVFALRDAMQRTTAGQEIEQEEVDALVAEEIGLADGADAVVTVSERERSVFTRHCPLPSVIWGHAIRVRRSDVPFGDRDDLLLVGNFETPPNADALRTLMNEHLPAIRGEVACRLYAVGALPHPNVVQAAEKQGEAVELKGFVPDLTEYYDRSRVFVAPHRFAGGIPLKVVEAMAHGLPCVMSELLGEQLGVRHGKHALLATSRQPFAECVTRLYRDRDLWESVQRAGYEFIEANFNPDSMRGALIQAIEDPRSIAPADARANGRGGERAPAAVAGSGRAEAPR